MALEFGGQVEAVQVLGADERYDFGNPVVDEA
jgi:hypothetical protein